MAQGHLQVEAKYDGLDVLNAKHSLYGADDQNAGGPTTAE
jgi:hypothetical protein